MKIANGFASGRRAVVLSCVLAVLAAGGFVGHRAASGGVPGDINNDAAVDFGDMGVLMEHWLSECSGPSWCEGADVDASGGVDLGDFAILAGEWLKSGGEPEPVEVIIDNGAAGTSWTGEWLPSGAPGYYGADSVYGRDGATYTWTFNAPVSSLYEVSMWWTEWSSRTTNAKVEIVSDDGTSTVYINQQANGERWNRLGEFYFAAGTNYGVTITSSPGPASTCADAVRFVRVAQAGPPVAGFYADSIRGGAPYAVQFHDQSSGEVNAWAWDFGDGQTSVERSPQHTYTNAGVFTVGLTVSGPHGTSRRTRWDYVDIKASTTENIYLVDGYAGNNYFLPDMKKAMQDLGATETATGWRYQPANSNMTYNMYKVRTPEAMVNALKEHDAHVIVVGHANFGFGTTFADAVETLNQRIDNIRYVDDERFVNYSTDMVSTKIDGMKYGQAYPNWEPIFKDGTSALMPYDFGDPRGNPPYNYYLTYRVPGDPMVYRIEMANGKYLERFPDASTPVWFSEDGSPPDPVQNPEFFIRNTDADYNRCDFVGQWVIRKDPAGGYSGESGYLGYNYHVRWPGSGQNKAIYTLVVEHPGLYAVMGSWYPDPNNNASNARYTIVHGTGTSVAYADQRMTQLINPIGAYYFGKGSYTVTLDDFANGQVIADAIALNPLENPASILLTDFAASQTSGGIGLEVEFSSRNSYFNLADPLGGVVEWAWDFGDGSGSSEPNPKHVYSAAGVYTVGLTVRDALGNEASEVKGDFIKVNRPAPLRAQFTALNRIGSDRVVARFMDQSSGNITSRHWDFGDGTTSNEQNPVHLYDQRGVYTVTLTVSGPDGSDAKTKTGYVYNLIGIIYADNTSQGRPHFYSRSGLLTFPKVICYTGDVKVPTAQMKYARMYHSACNSFPYFAEAFNRGVMFAKTSDVKVEHDSAVPYLDYYLRGYTDRDILAYINTIEGNHEYYNFNEKPPSMRIR